LSPRPIDPVRQLGHIFTHYSQKANSLAKKEKEKEGLIFVSSDTSQV